MTLELHPNTVWHKIIRLIRWHKYLTSIWFIYQHLSQRLYRGVCAPRDCMWYRWHEFIMRPEDILWGLWDLFPLDWSQAGLNDLRFIDPPGSHHQILSVWQSAPMCRTDVLFLNQTQKISNEIPHMMNDFAVKCLVLPASRSSEIISGNKVKNDMYLTFEAFYWFFFQLKKLRIYKVKGDKAVKQMEHFMPLELIFHRVTVFFTDVILDLFWTAQILRHKCLFSWWRHTIKMLYSHMNKVKKCHPLPFRGFNS